MISILNRSICGCGQVCDEKVNSCRICGYRYCSIRCLVEDYSIHKPRCFAPITGQTPISDITKKSEILQKTATVFERLASAVGQHRDKFKEQMLTLDPSGDTCSFQVLKGNEDIEEWLKKPVLCPLPKSKIKPLLAKVSSRSGAKLPVEPPLFALWVEGQDSNGKKGIKFVC